MEYQVFAPSSDLSLEDVPLEDEEYQRDIYYLTAKNLVAAKYLNRCNLWRRSINLLAKERIRTLAVMGLVIAGIVLSVISLNWIVILIGAAGGGFAFWYFFQHFQLIGEELHETTAALGEEEPDYEVTGLKRIKLPVYINKVIDQKAIVVDAARIFPPVEFQFQLMKEPQLVREGIQNFKEKFTYLNRFVVMPNRRDYELLLSQPINREAVQAQLLEQILNPSFEKIKRSFHIQNLEENRITLNALREGSPLTADIKNVLARAQLQETTSDIIGTVGQHRDVDWFVTQTISELKNLINDLNKWINTIVRSSLPDFLDKKRKKAETRMQNLEKKLGITRDMIVATFPKDLAVFHAFNNFQYCSTCGSTNVADIREDMDLREYIERVILNNATEDQLIQEKVAPEILVEDVRAAKSKVEHSFRKLPVPTNIRPTNGIERETYPQIVADYRTMTLERRAGEFQYTCPMCSGTNYIEVNRSIEPIAHAYLSCMNVLREKMEKEKGIFIRNISDIKISKEQKIGDLAPYKLAWQEAIGKMSDLKTQIEIAQMMLDELKRTTT